MKNPRDFILKKSEKPKGVKIKGHDFSKNADFHDIMKSFSTTGMQAKNFSEAVEIISEMIKTKTFIYLGFTSNMVTSGLRDIFRYLAEKKKVDVIVTTVGGIEEDIIKCLDDFVLGSFRENGKELRKKGINRAGNILIPSENYVKFEKFVLPILEEFYKRQKETGEILNPSELIWKLGEKINNKNSIYYWAWKNKIPVFCPAIGDGSLGDMLYFFKSKHEDFVLDIMEDIWELNNTSTGKEKTGMIILGAGVVKHSICNANLYRNGADFAVYINEAHEETGSDSGANPDEAVSWGKISTNGKSVKVFGDAILLFPFIVAETFAK
jgi:deoxyhypusine synthase